MKTNRYITIAGRLFSVLIISLALVSCNRDDKEDLIVNSSVRLVLNEVHPGGTPAWIELYNSGTHPQPLKGLKISNDEGNSYALPEDSILFPGAYYLVYFGGDTLNCLHAPFSLGKMGQGLKLRDTEGLLIDAVDYPVLPESQSFGRYMDASKGWAVNLVPSPGMNNDPSLNRPPNIYHVRVNAASPFPGTPIYVHTELTDDNFIMQAFVHYSYPGFDSIAELSPYSCGTSFRASIPPLPLGTEVDFYISAYDEENLYARFPLTAPLDRLKFTVSGR